MLLLLLGLAGVLLSALPSLPSDMWWVRYPDFPRLEILPAMLFVAVVLALLPRRGWPVLPTVVALVAASIFSVVRLGPYLIPALVPVGMSWPPPQVASAASCPDGDRLRILEANVQMTNGRDHRLLQIVRDAQPDIAWFQETNAWWERELAPLADVMPHGIAQAQKNYFGVHFFSRLPLEQTEIRNLTSSRNPSVFTSVVLPSGRRVRIYAIHPRPPQVGQSTAERDAQLMATALAAREDAIPHLIVGDLNAVPWETVLDRTRRVAGVHDPRVGRGLYVTWNANRWLLKWPLDHVLPGPGFVLLRLQVLPAFGSDHLPFLADLCAVDASPEHVQIDQAELDRARAVVTRGQDKADAAGAALPPSAESDEKRGGE